ncbi:AraC family transcriptional regulator [Pedobacter sp. HMWF019]|uniref:AraC family transcriptional regulator n=1 Tax=Pedobacter sp. HMWF019 TaxID=2056856 RepID=UPI000D3CBAFE|nr:AraC family transcriptional regulator [Pedobacter sp. HMWF019]PTS99822.1 AraC family transcriptional regulator [Pedobacter sp. HMWF019]
MNRTQFEQLVIHDFEEKSFHLPVHGHTYYELVYIRKGAGLHLLNNNQLEYKAGDLFIVSPADQHYFEIKKSTHFTFIKFTDSYFAKHKMNRPDALSLSTPEAIMNNKLLKEVKLKMDEPCISILRNTVENIVAYNCRKDVASSPLVYYQILSIFGLIREAAAKLSIRIDDGQSDKEELISYIHQHIYEPSLIQIKNISTQFHIAPTYFSDYFKRKFAVGYRDYVNTYRIKLIEKRLQASGLTLKQIAQEFGFTDESHLSHFFKTMRKMSPLQFRNLNRS